jgi:hypothetical protein
LTKSALPLIEYCTVIAVVVGFDVVTVKTASPPVRILVGDTDSDTVRPDGVGVGVTVGVGMGVAVGVGVGVAVGIGVGVAVGVGVGVGVGVAVGEGVGVGEALGAPYKL